MSLRVLHQQPDPDRRDLVGNARVLRFDLQPAARRQREAQFAAMLVSLGILDQVGGVHGLSVAPLPTGNATATSDQWR